MSSAAYLRSRKVRNKMDGKKIGYLVDGKFDSYNNCALLVFKNPKTDRTFIWRDNTEHKAYLYTSASPKIVKEMYGNDKDFLNAVEVEKYDPVSDAMVTITKVTSNNPYDIGGKLDSYRLGLGEAGFKVWEAWIQYHNSYCYDKKLEFNMPYIVTDKKVIPYVSTSSIGRKNKVIRELRNKDLAITEAVEHFIRLFEADIPKYRFLALDIEVLPTGNKVPDTDMVFEPILCIGLTDSDGKRTLLMYEREGQEKGDLDLENCNVRMFKSERDMIMALFGMIDQYKMIVTFNGDTFDLKYIYNRAINRLDIPKNSVPLYYSSRRNQTNIKYAEHIDLFKFFSNRSIQIYAFKAAYKRYSLDAISEALLGDNKIKNDKKIGDLSLGELGKYCMQDVDLTANLLKFKDNVALTLMITLSRMSNLTLEQVCRTKISTWTKSTFYYYHRLKNMLIPSAEDLKAKGNIQTGALIKGKKYKGAIVHEPKPGIYFKVKVLDFASLYPSEVKERNICYSTINCSHPECEDNKVPDTTHHICTKRVGICSLIVGGLRDARVGFYKGESRNPDNPMQSFYGVFEQAIKVYINAAYGVFGSEMFALYCAPVAESITAYSRNDMSKITNKAEEMGIVVIGGDTDSIFLDNPTDGYVDELIRWSKSELQLDLGVDATFRYGIWSKRKKNYLGVMPDGKLTIKGLTGKKSNTPQYIKDPFGEITTILSNAMTLEDIEDGKSDIKALTLRRVEDLKSGNFKLEDLAFEIELGKPLDQYDTNPQHVRAARRLRDEGYDITDGYVVSFIKGKNGEAMPTILADKKKVDINKYISQLNSTLAQILEPLNIEFDYDILGKPKPKLLTDFMPQNE